MAFVIADRVKETSTTTGTGALTLAGAMLGFQSFSSKCAVGDTVFYGVQAVDVQGGPSGEWECGLGTYSAANTLTRTTVTSSSNSDAAVSFSAGTKHVYISMPATQAAWIRERITAARTYYVSTTGSDSADGLTVGTPFQTIQKAIDTVCDKIDAGPHQVTIQLVDGTYTSGGVLKGYVGFLPPIIQGNATTPANTFVSVSTAGVSCFSNLLVPVVTTADSHNTTACGAWTIKNLKVSSGRAGIELLGGGSSVNFSGINFGSCTGYHIIASTGGLVRVLGNYTISGSAVSHMLSYLGGEIIARDATVTFLASIVLTQFVHVWLLGFIMCPYLTFTMGGFSVTGKRYLVESNGVVNSYAGGAGYFPGSTAGTTASGGLYI